MGRPVGSKDRVKRTRRPKTTIEDYKEREWLGWRRGCSSVQLESKHLVGLIKLFDMYLKSPLKGKQWPKRYDHYVGYGLLFGYNLCCIMAFLEWAQYSDVRKKESPRPDNDFWGTGFCPCDTCLSCKDTSQIITDIDSRRHSSITPFSIGYLKYKERRAR
jgi:hypothetical protein